MTEQTTATPVKITRLSVNAVAALRETFTADTVTLTATTATFTGPDPLAELDRIIANLPGRGHPRASLHSARRKLAAALADQDTPAPAADQTEAPTAGTREDDQDAAAALADGETFRAEFSITGRFPGSVQLLDRAGVLAIVRGAIERDGDRVHYDAETGCTTVTYATGAARRIRPADDCDSCDGSGLIDVHDEDDFVTGSNPCPDPRHNADRHRAAVARRQAQEDRAADAADGARLWDGAAITAAAPPADGEQAPAPREDAPLRMTHYGRFGVHIHAPDRPTA